MPGEENPPAEQTAAAPAAEDSRPEESTPRGEEPHTIPLGAVATSDLLVSFLGLLASKAWEGMGLVPNPATSKIEKDLAGARLAIDAYAAVFDVVRPEVGEQPRREIEALLTTLRLNFVDKSGKNP